MKSEKTENCLFNCSALIWPHAFIVAGRNNEIKKLKWVGIGALVFSIIGCAVGQAQETADSFSGINLSVPSGQNGVLALSGTDIRSISSWSDEQLTNLVNVLDATPAIPFADLPKNRWGGKMGGTFWSLQNSKQPPLPGDTIGVAVWPMQDGSFLLDDINYSYDSAYTTGSMQMSAMDSGLSGPPPPGGGGTNSYTPNGSNYTPLDPGTNLWIAQTAVAAGYLTGTASNTIADVSYEIQSCTNLMQTDWLSEGFFPGSELTNWTAFSVVQDQSLNLFVRLRSWMDTYGIGIPDWWQFEFFGTNGIDPDASAGNDGFSNLEKFDMGLNPTNYYNPNGPPGFFGYLDTTGTNVFIAWSPAPGPVVNYSIQRGISNSLTGLYGFSQVGTVSSNANFIKDAGAINNSNALNNIYQLESVYPGGSLSATDTWQVIWFSQYGTLGMPYGPPAPTNFYAYADTTATNALLSWSSASSVATNYLIERGIFNTTSNAWVYHQIASVSPATNSFTVSRPFTNSANWSDNYSLVAVYPGGVRAPWAVSPVNVGNTNGVAGPGSFFGYADGAGTNLVLTWTPAAGSPTNYVIFAGTINAYGTYAYAKLTSVNGGATSLLVTNGYNNLYQAYAIFATYTNGSLSQAAFWQSATGTPAPGNFVAYFDATGTNVWLSWTAPAGAITGYQIVRFDPDSEYFIYNVNSNTTSFEDTNAVNIGDFDPVNTIYTVQAFYPQGGASPTAWTALGTLPTPTGLSSVLDVTGKNVNVTWSAVPGATGYVVDRGVLNPATGNYSYSQIATVWGVTSYVDTGAITGPNSYNNQYEVAAIFPGGVDSGFENSSVSESSAVPLSNVYVSANLIRNGTGRWQVMFSGLPTNSPQTVQLTWGDGYGDNISQINLLTTSVTNGVYPVPDALALDLLNYELYTGLTVDLTVQLFGPNGEPGQIEIAGYFAQDAPYFVDGRQHSKQNLEFLIRAASVNQLFYSPGNAGYGVSSVDFYGGQYNETATNFEEFSFLHHLEPNQEDLYYFAVDSLWPFTANYELDCYLVDTSRTNDNNYGEFPYGYTNFNFTPNFATNIPAPAILTPTAPYWILQPGFNLYLKGLGSGSPPSDWSVSVTAGNTRASMSSGHNLLGLTYSSGYLVAYTNTGQYNYQVLSPGGGNVTVPPGYVIDNYASWCPVPTLQLVNYYFAPLITFGTNYLFFSGTSGVQLPGEFQSVLPGDLGFSHGSPVQPFPVPIEEDFNVTNQTPPLIATVGQPMVVAGWAKYSIQGSSPTKYAYLGQYFVTNAFLLNSNGVPTTNSAGVMSPYGEFFPLQAGVAQVVTMQDIDPPYQQGTNVVKIISMNVDANHDGVMDLSYAGPDQNSPARPFHFWANDDQDAGDFGGNFGIPGQGQDGDGFRVKIHNTLIPVPGPEYATAIANAYGVNGRRDLVDFFPVYLNIGSLFQSNALSAGINPNDPSYQFALSQADGVLRFAYTSLTPTNYMNFLRDINVSSNLVDPATVAWPILPQGTLISSSFLMNIATNNGGIILVEAAAPTTQPLVLTIYHGTNQIAQTSLSISISGVEQMFRSKTMMLNPAEGTVPDRLTDASVPNEPDTIDKNFVFMHGYNVNPNEARGVAADMYKRMYWSGSHAKFYAVTWEGADSKLGSLFTPNYHTNVVNAFNTAPLLANFIASLTNSGPVVVAAHSLGNMLTLSAISDCHAPISQYFMMDSAVPIEAIDSASTNVAFMTFSTWGGYSNRLFAAYWCQLFPTNDARSTLSWNNRLGNLGSVDVYNFYSSGEDVLRLTAGDPPLTTINIVASQLINWSWPGLLWPDVPFGTYSWYWQEKGKGTCNEDGLIGSSHGGWKFSTYWVTSGLFPVPLSPTIMNGTTNTILQTQPMFDFNSTANNFLLDVDSELLGSVPGVNPSTYAATYRNRILSDAIPAMSLVAGANPVPSLDQPGQPHNFDMQSVYENGWAAGRPKLQVGNPAAGEWHHSDFVQMAYPFTHQLFDKFVTTGNLK